MKSSGLHPNGSQTMAAAVSISTPRWASTLLKKVPLKDVRTCPFVFLLRVDAFGSGVGRLGRNAARNWRTFVFSLTPLLKHKPWQIWLPPFSTLSLIGNKVRQVANVHSLDCVLWLTRGFQGYNIDATYLAAFRCKNISAHLLLAQNLLCLLLYRALQVETEPPSSSHTTPYPGHPAAPGFKRRRAASWCLFELCVKYRYGKSPRGETHKALTVSYWVLVPITHLRGLFSCQLPRRDSQLHNF